jgi:hypothetical protein
MSDVWFGGYLTTIRWHQKMFRVVRYEMTIALCEFEEIGKKGTGTVSVPADNHNQPLQNTSWKRYHLCQSI